MRYAGGRRSAGGRRCWVNAPAASVLRQALQHPVAPPSSSAQHWLASYHTCQPLPTSLTHPEPSRKLLWVQAQLQVPAAAAAVGGAAAARQAGHRLCRRVPRVLPLKLHGHGPAAARCLEEGAGYARLAARHLRATPLCQRPGAQPVEQRAPPRCAPAAAAPVLAAAAAAAVGCRRCTAVPAPAAAAAAGGKV